MAVAVPSVYLAVSRPVKERTNTRNANDDVDTWRLPPNHVLDLRDVATGVEESNAGVCCRYLIDHMSSTSSPDVDAEDGYVHRLHEIERFVERYGDFGKIPFIASWRNRITRTRRALERLRHRGDHRHADVLMVAYGQPDPFASMLAGPLGRELANLARYTDAVELRRIELVRIETARLADAQGDVIDLARRRAQFEWASKAISSGDAVRHALAAFHEAPCTPLEGEGRLAFEARKEARKERQRAHDAKREAFLLDTKVDARRMLVRAERAYHDAWLRSR